MGQLWYGNCCGLHFIYETCTSGKRRYRFTVQTVITHLMGIIIAVIGGVIAHYVGYAGMFATQSAIALASFFYTLQMNKTVK